MLVQYTLFLFATCVYQAWTLDMDTNSADSVKSGLSQIAKGIIDYYNGHDPGIRQACLCLHTTGGSQEPHG